MFTLIFMYSLISILGICFLLWMRTPNGRKWLKEL